MSQKVRRSAAIYYLIQGIAVFAWWGMLFLRPETRRFFVLEAQSELSLLAFFPADIFFLAFGSVVVAALCATDHEYKKIGAWFVTGGMSYSAVTCFSYTTLTDHGWLGVALMLPAMIWSGVFAVGLSFEKVMFRQAAATATSWIIAKTMVQILIVWSLILGVFPFLITLLEDKLGIERFSFAYQLPMAVILFLIVSSIGITSSIVMCRIGRGTPLPLDHATKLVIQGPYSYVRNPMAVCGILQGLSVALLLGSPLVAIYALMGSAIWQLIFRPLEEDDLAERFGSDFENYRKNVRCWIPTSKAYRPD